MEIYNLVYFIGYLLQNPKLLLNDINGRWRVALMVTTLWFIQFARCQRIFNNNRIDPDSLINIIIKFVIDQHILTKWKYPSLLLHNNLVSINFWIDTGGSFVNGH